eukprot:1160816-Pelagomonas_calceolata.AAC.5
MPDERQHNVDSIASWAAIFSLMHTSGSERCLSIAGPADCCELLRAAVFDCAFHFDLLCLTVPSMGMPSDPSRQCQLEGTSCSPHIGAADFDIACQEDQHAGCKWTTAVSMAKACFCA